MKSKLYIVSFILICGCSQHTSNNLKVNEEKRKTVASVYKIILKTYNPEPVEEDDTLEIPGNIDINTIKNLSEPLKALTAFYSAMGSSYCDKDSCELTTDLGLGKQGSDNHKNLINKYLPNDSVAGFLIKQNCYLSPDGSSFFNDYEYLTLIDLGDTVKVDYILYNYDRGDEYFTKQLDIYSYNNGTFKKTKRDDKWIQ